MRRIARVWAPGLVFSVLAAFASPAQADPERLPATAPDWSIRLIAQAPQILHPTALAAAPGVLYIGSDPMDMPGPASRPIDKILALRAGKATVFADSLWSVMGLEWLDDALYVVHAPYLSRLRDRDHDGKADERVDLVTGLGPQIPGFSGLNDHVAAGIRFGYDGFLYIAVGDKGIPKATGKDGKSITLEGGGVIRVRPDGSDLEIVSSGERSPMSVAITAQGELFSLGNDDDSRAWPCSLTHHIVGGRYGYPFEFQARWPSVLPIVAGYRGGAGAQGLAYEEDALPDEYRGNLLFCDWGLQAVLRFELKPNGATFRAVQHPSIVTRGPVDDFRPFALAIDPESGDLWLADWGYNGWSASTPAGRIYRLSHRKARRLAPAPPAKESVAELVRTLDHPALAMRMNAQRKLAARGEEAVEALAGRLRSKGPETGCRHALWALDAIDGETARKAIRLTLIDLRPGLRAETTRWAGIRSDILSSQALQSLLGDPEPLVRREAAIALGKLGDRRAGPALYASLIDSDRFVAYSVREAIRRLKIWDVSMLADVLQDPARSTQALLLVRDVHEVPVVEALLKVLTESHSPALRRAIVDILAELYFERAPWDGSWYGSDPLSGPPPARNQPWTKQGMDLVLKALELASSDLDCEVRLAAVKALAPLGAPAAPILRHVFGKESDFEIRALAVSSLGRTADILVTDLIAKMINSPDYALVDRINALESLHNDRDAKSLRARLQLIFDDNASADLVARAIPPLARGGFLPTADLSRFLEHPAPQVRLAALLSLKLHSRLSEEVELLVLDRLEDSDPQVRRAAFLAVAPLRLQSALPRLLLEATRPNSPDRWAATWSLCQLPHRQATQVYLSTLQDRDPTLRQAAEHALSAIRDQVEAELKSALDHADQGPLKETLRRILAPYEPITSWKLAGPLPRTTPLDILTTSKFDFSRPLFDAYGEPLKWHDRHPESAATVLLDDLRTSTPSPNRTGYAPGLAADLQALAVARIDAPEDCDAILRVGSSGSLVIAVGGTLAYQFLDPSGRPFDPASDHVQVRLKKGPNTIALASQEGLGAWRFSVQVARLTAGNPNPSNQDPIAVRRQFARSHPGDPQAGERLFFSPAGPGCHRCHSVAGKGDGRFGPDLAGIASIYDQAELIRSVLEPSSRVAAAYRTTIAATRSGAVHQGLARPGDPAELVLVEPNLQITRIPRAEILSQRTSNQSFMPSGLIDSLSPVEFADLIAFLSTLKSQPAQP